MSNATAYLFPGQGSQVKGMGNELFANYPNLCQEAETILGYCVKTICLENPENKLNDTRYTQPALYVVNALHYLQILEHKDPPNFVAGHSLGEYNALLAANVFDFATGLRLVQKRSELMSRAKGGAMAALIGLTYNQVERLLEEYALTTVTIANYNSYRQFVISGLSDDINRAKTLIENQKTAMFIPLKVSGAFHSLHMLEAEREFSEFLSTFKFNFPTLPVLANCNAKIYHPSVISKNLSTHITHPVQWSKIVEYLLERGTTDFQEIGPGNVLSGLVHRIKQGD